MIDIPQAVLTKSKNGRIEVRALDMRGRFVMYKYLDSKSLKPTDAKRKLSLRDEEGTLKEYFIIPLKAQKRYLLIEAEQTEKERLVWNEKNRRAEELWG